jgi:hypothetical protein
VASKIGGIMWTVTDQPDQTMTEVARTYSEILCR